MFRSIIIALIAWAGACGQQNQLTSEESSAGWELLFDGKDMSKWNDPRRMSPPGDAWTIEDGCLKARANPQITEDLFTREAFRDFDFVFEWRISPRGNSGVKYRIQDHVFLLHEPVKRFEDLVNLSVERPRGTRPSRGQDYVVAFEYQLLDDRGHPDSKAGPSHETGAVYDMIPPSQAASRPVGEFNQSRIVLRGNHVEHWLNGIKVVDADLGAEQVVERTAKRWGRNTPVYNLLIKQPKRSCPISLQNHGAGTWFRNLKIRRLE